MDLTQRQSGSITEQIRKKACGTDRSRKMRAGVTYKKNAVLQLSATTRGSWSAGKLINNAQAAIGSRGADFYTAEDVGWIASGMYKQQWGIINELSPNTPATVAFIVPFAQSNFGVFTANFDDWPTLNYPPACVTGARGATNTEVTIGNRHYAGSEEVGSVLWLAIGQQQAS